MMLTSSYSLITGGAGFIGTNLAHALALQGNSIVIYDNLSQPGVEKNLSWLLAQHPDQITFFHGDIRDAKALQGLVSRSEVIFHLAAQVAGTSQSIDPILDFEVNARGTLNLLEALRYLRNPPPLIYASTNKVLGALEEIYLLERETRYEPENEVIRNSGINEHFGLDFCTPFGCSKGAGEQYVLAYAKAFRIPAVVFRMSCIYGPHQLGDEDHGWISYFIQQILNSKTITLYGDGKQVRDILSINDLVDALLLGLKQIHRTSSQAFHIGGGPHNSISLIELIQFLSESMNRRAEVKKEDWRTLDQRYYVSDTSKFSEFTGWAPKISYQEGLVQLISWIQKDTPCK